MKSGTAAQRAEEAAQKTKDSIALWQTEIDFTTAISTLEEVKRLHRQNEWALLPDRYFQIRKLLITLRASDNHLNDKQQTFIQNTIANLSNFEKTIERSQGDTSTLKLSRFNALISDDIDNLLTVLTQLKVSRTGGNLLERTNNGKLAWKPTGDENTFRVSFKGNSIEISERENDWYVSLVDQEGNVVDTTSGEELNKYARDALSGSNWSSWYTPMSELYALARRSAVGADKMLSEILDEFLVGQPQRTRSIPRRALPGGKTARLSSKCPGFGGVAIRRGERSMRSLVKW